MPARSKLTPVDLSRWRNGNNGIDFTTTLESGRAGPHAMIMALIHGNELCGAHAITFLHEHLTQPVKGRISLALGNIAAYRRFESKNIGASRYLDEDMNRVWSGDRLEGPSNSVELRRARELRPLVDKVDFLLDLHAMENTGPPLILSGPLDRSVELARWLGTPQFIVRDAGHANGTRLRDYSNFSSNDHHHTALLIECGQREDPESARVAIDASLKFLLSLDLIRPLPSAMFQPLQPMSSQDTIQVTDAVTVDTDAFSFLIDVEGFQVIDRAGTVIARDGDRPIMTPYDSCVLVMPSREAKRGQTAVRFGHVVTD